MRQAIFTKKFHTLTLWTDRNVQTHINCYTPKQAKAIIKAKGFEPETQTLKIGAN